MVTSLGSWRHWRSGVHRQWCCNLRCRGHGVVLCSSSTTIQQLCRLCDALTQSVVANTVQCASCVGWGSTTKPRGHDCHYAGFFCDEQQSYCRLWQVLRTLAPFPRKGKGTQGLQDDNRYTTQCWFPQVWLYVCDRAKRIRRCMGWRRRAFHRCQTAYHSQIVEKYGYTHSATRP